MARFRFCWMAFLPFLLTTTTHAQVPDPGEMGFRTINGKIGFQGICNDTFFTAGSNALKVITDDLFTILNIRVDLQTVRYDNGDSVHGPFDRLAYPLFFFRGELNVGELNPVSSYSQSFLITGDLEINGISKQVTIYGNLQPYHSGEIAYLLTIDFDLDIREFMLDKQFPGCYEYFHVEVMQAILRKY